MAAGRAARPHLCLAYYKFSWASRQAARQRHGNPSFPGLFPAIRRCGLLRCGCCPLPGGTAAEASEQSTAGQGTAFHSLLEGFRDQRPFLVDPVKDEEGQDEEEEVGQPHADAHGQCAVFAQEPGHSEGDIVEDEKGQPQRDARGPAARPGLESQWQPEQAQDEAAHRQAEAMIVFGEIDAALASVFSPVGRGFQKLALAHGAAGHGTEVFAAHPGW